MENNSNWRDDGGRLAKLNESSFDNPPLFSSYSFDERENRAVEKDSCWLAGRMAVSIFVGWFASFAILFTGHNKASRRSIYTDSRNGLFVRKRGREGGGGILLKAVDNVSVMLPIDRKWFSSKCDDSFKTGFFFMGRFFFFLFVFCLVRYYPAIPLFLSLFALLYIPWVCSIVGERGAFYKKMRWMEAMGDGEKDGRQATKQTKETRFFIGCFWTMMTVTRFPSL